jgi:hypothetical protein
LSITSIEGLALQNVMVVLQVQIFTKNKGRAKGFLGEKSCLTKLMIRVLALDFVVA